MIIGHERQRAYLDSIVRTNRVPHAFLFIGPEHTGKRLVALDWCARAAGTDPAPFYDESHPDLLVVRPGEKSRGISIDQIRELRRFAGLSPRILKRKFAIVDSAHLLNRPAANALLKTLEEPPVGTHIILIATGIASLPQTVRSRTVVVQFYPITASAIERSSLVDRSRVSGEHGWIAGRPGLAIRWSNNPDDEYIAALRRAFADYQRVRDAASVKETLAYADDVARSDYVAGTLAAWMLAARHALKNGGTIRDLSFMRHIRETAQRLDAIPLNVRLQIESLLLANQQ